MTCRPVAIAFATVLAVSSTAWAQAIATPGEVGPSLEMLASGASRGTGVATGLKLGDEAILHAGVFADIGYDTNVFYSRDQRSSAVLHLLPKLELSNAERDGSVPSLTHYIIFATLDWRKYLTSDDAVITQDALNPSLGAAVQISPHRSFTLTLTDTFTRSQQAPFSAGEPITRDYNLASVNLRYSPGGGRLTINLRYSNTIDKYEGSYDRGSNMTNEVVLDGGLQFLPKTAFYAQVSQGAVTYFNSGNVNSFPLRTTVGLRGLVTAKLSVNLGAGYINAFYSSGASPSGVDGNLGGVAEVNYTMGPLARAGLGYRHGFANSPFVGQYYNADAIYAAYQQLIARRFTAYLYGRYENRRFGALPVGASRTDNYALGGVSLDYAVVGRFLLLGASYDIHVNRATESGGQTGAVDFTKQVLLFRLGLVY